MSSRPLCSVALMFSFVMTMSSGCGPSMKNLVDRRAASPATQPENSGIESAGQPEIPYTIVSTDADGVRTVEFQVTTYATEIRTRDVPVEKQRMEDRVRHVTDDDGKKRDEPYQIAVPYNEMVAEQYEVQVPLTETRTIQVPPGQDIAKAVAASSP